MKIGEKIASFTVIAGLLTAAIYKGDELFEAADKVIFSRIFNKPIPVSNNVFKENGEINNDYRLNGRHGAENGTFCISVAKSEVLKNVTATFVEMAGRGNMHKKEIEYNEDNTQACVYAWVDWDNNNTAVSIQLKGEKIRRSTF